MKNEHNEYRQKLAEIIIAKRQELEHRQNRLNNNILQIYISTKKNYILSTNTIDSLEYKFQHNL